MSCKLNKEFLYSYADNTIDPLEKILLEEHLKYCEECSKALALILSIDNTLIDLGKENLTFPKKLNTISKLVAENCISKIEEDNLKLKIKNMYKSYKLTNSSIRNSRNLYKKNPFNRFINKNIKKPITLIKKPIKKSISSKIKKINIFNLFNAS